ncbi:MAG: hypothetical protein K0S91_1557 [Nitrososphaeraceae archaeon]|nr:hypothetical protein [Nitrososphaeraceae archaeon]
MRLSQATPNLLKAVILAESVIIILVLLMLLQFSSYYAKATTLEQQHQHQQLSLSPSHSSSSTTTITKDTPPQKENKSIMMMTKLLAKSNTDIGAWDPYQMPLEELQGSKQEKAIKALLEQGFSEYYFVMNDFNDSKVKRAVEKLLKSSDKTDLKILIILLPPSEGGPDGNYDWDGWIDYFNDLKDEHRSFKGFTIDDFNWISTRNDTKFWRNIDYMKYSNLSKALHEKREDVQFYPVIYFEGEGTKTEISEYSKFIDGVILASACYYNITNLEKDLLTFARIFDNEPIRYVVYPTITYNYSRINYNPPSDRLVMATLSIATKVADGILIWRGIDSHVVEDYLSNHDDHKYLSKISKIEKLQIRDEIIWRKANPTLANSELFQGYCHI